MSEMKTARKRQETARGSEQGVELLIDERQRWDEHSLLDLNEVVIKSVEPSETAKGLARVLGLNHMIEPILAEFPALAGDDPRRQITMARIALEFFDRNEFTTSEAIARFLHKSPEVALLVGALKESANLADIDEFIEESVRFGQGYKKVEYRKLASERRYELSRTLRNHPFALLAVLGSDAIHSYNAYVPDTKEEFLRSLIGKFYDELNDEDRPKLTHSHLEWLQKLVGDNVKLDNQWFQRTDLLVLLGSKQSLFWGAAASAAAKEVFYNRLGLNNDVINRYRLQVKPQRFIRDINLLQSYGITNIDVIAREVFRIFREGDQSLEAKLRLIAAKGYDFNKPEVQSLLPLMLPAKLATLEGKLPPYRPGLTKEDIRPKPGPKGSTTSRPRKSTVPATQTKPTRKAEASLSEALSNSRTQAAKPEEGFLSDAPTIETNAEAGPSTACLSLAGLIALYIDSNLSDRTLAKRLELVNLSEKQLNLLTEFVESSQTELTLKSIRAKISTLEF